MRLFSLLLALVSSSASTPTAGLRGIMNLGNTCYLGSALQVLSHSSALQEVLSSFPAHSLNPVSQELKNLVHYMWESPANHPDSNLDPSAILANMGLLRIGVSEDVTLALSIILSNLRESGIDLLTTSAIKTLTCLSCREPRESPEVFTQLNLPLIPGPGMTLKDSFGLQFAAQSLVGVDCPSCANPTDTCESVSLTRTAPLLILSLKRLGPDRKKIKTPLHIPLVMDMSEMAPGGTGLYTLIGLIHHVGTPVGGHYLADFLNKEDRTWYRANDSSILPMAGPSLITKTGTTIVYERLLDDIDTSYHP